MSESIVIVPSTANQSWDFLGFSFNGKHSWDDFKIIRTSDGDRYNINLGPQSQDKTAENPGGDGMYFFGSNHKQKVFDIKFAFKELDDVKLREIKRWLSGKEVGDLWFDEEPYKVYSAKVTGQPSIKVIPFDNYNANGEKIGRVYKGDGSVQFTCYWPYAHTPDYVCKEEFTLQAGVTEPFIETVRTQYLYVERTDGKTNQVNIQFKYGATSYAGQNITTNTKINLKATYSLMGVKITAGNLKCKIYITDSEDKPENRKLIYASKNGKDLDSYSDFANKSDWSIASGLTTTDTCNGENPGELPAPFIFKHNNGTADFTINENTSKTFKVGNLEITVGGTGSKSLTGVTWDSKTGMVSAKVDGDSDYTPIPYIGTPTGAIPVDGITTLDLDGGTLTYHYWYY